MKTVWEMDAGGGGGIGEDENTQWDPEEATTSRGNSTRQLVNLGQSNRSSGDILEMDTTPAVTAPHLD